MAFQKGHKYSVGNEGTEKTFKTPEDLWEKFKEYVAWASKHPWIKKEAIKSGEHVGELIDIPIERPLTLSGFAVYCDITLRCLQNYGYAKGYNNYFRIYEKIENNCYSQKFEGAAVGMFNASIIARDLGLTEKVDNTINGEVNIKPKRWIKKD